jgi:hypothetical protein
MMAINTTYKGGRMGRPCLKAEKVFFECINKLDTGCWEWNREIHSTTGYGRFRASNIDWGAHRFSYFYYKGEIPNRYHIHHICENRWCVNPKHLKAVSSIEHIHMSNGWAGKNHRKNYCKNGHKFTKKNTYKRIRNNSLRRECRTCRNGAVKKWLHS